MTCSAVSVIGDSPQATAAVPVVATRAVTTAAIASARTHLLVGMATSGPPRAI